jgi:hypothetical protein
MPEGKATNQSVISRRQMLSRSLAVAGLSVAAVATVWSSASASGEGRQAAPAGRQPCPTPAAHTRETIMVPDSSQPVIIEHLGPNKTSVR